MTKGSLIGTDAKPEIKPGAKVKFKAKPQEYKRLSAWD
jgi:hypothetical protein